MPLNPNGTLKNQTLILTKDQIARLQELADDRSTSYRKVRISDVAREVVEVGLGQISQVSDTTSSTTITEAAA